jgi:hypothetical protein
MTLDWLVIGGGIHGVHIATRLLEDAGVAHEALRIVDPGTRLLERWRENTAVTGMKHLRSPSVHHLDIGPWSLQRFAGKRKSRKPGLFAYPYDRPALSLFNAHCQRVIDDHRLTELHIQARCERLAVDCDAVEVVLSTGESVKAQNVVLAIGASEQPAWPDWAPPGTAGVHHVFELGPEKWPVSKETVCVVGGGITAGQVALRLLQEGHQVHIIARHALREHQFDSDPGWLGPKFMANFEIETDVERRRQLIGEARHRGSVSPDVHRGLRRAIDDGELQWHLSEISGLDAYDTEIGVQLTSGDEVKVHRVLLATGFETNRPGGAMVDELVASAQLPCASCGYPVVDHALRWHPRIHVSGPLAELELGPASRNIAGARRAGDRLVHAIRASAAGL